MRVLLYCAPLPRVVAYLSAIGEIDGRHCLIEWKTPRTPCYSAHSRRRTVPKWIATAVNTRLRDIFLSYSADRACRAEKTRSPEFTTAVLSRGTIGREASIVFSLLCAKHRGSRDHRALTCPRSRRGKHS